MSDNDKNIKTKLEDQGQDKQPQQAFRGVAIHLAVDGKFGLELIGVTKMEVYGALSLIIDKMKKDLQGGN